MTEWTVSPGYADGERAWMEETLGISFMNASDKNAAIWVDQVGRENFRLVRDDRALAGLLNVIEMGQFFGGRSVPMVGISGVAVSPIQRGRGAASALMASVCREYAERGDTPLSALYPASLALYQGVGYDLAGGRYKVSMTGWSMKRSYREGELVTLPSDSVPAEARALHRQQAAVHNGTLDRGAFIWHRTTGGGQKPTVGYGVRAPDGTLEGYVYLRRFNRDGSDHTWLSDFVAVTERATRRLFTLLGDLKTTSESVSWAGSPSDPRLALCADPTYKVTLYSSWMLRVLDVAAALQARGYSPGVSGVVHLDVADELLPANAGRYVLDVREGRAEVTRGGRGDVALDVRGLASIYSGYATGHDLRLVGLAAGGDAELAALTALFAGPAPWMAGDF